MVMRRSHSALLSKYLEQYKRKPSSRVFAPLAEAYRKLGMHDEALKVLREGIRRNPTYVLGYLVLAECYADQLHWDRVHQTLQPLTAYNKDNVSLQKLFAKACLETGDLETALETYKWLLFLSPRDQDFAAQVRSLEDDLMSRQKTIPREALLKAPESSADHGRSFGSDEDDWTMVSFESQEEALPADSEDNWSMSTAQSTAQSTMQPTKAEEWQVMARPLDDDFFSDEEVTPEYAEAPIMEEGKPLVSHTLVDLYVAQHHYEQAIELLEKFLEVNPFDERSRERLMELQRTQHQSTAELSQNEEDGQAELLRLVQSQVQAQAPVAEEAPAAVVAAPTPSLKKLEAVYRLFLQHIQLRADESRYGHV